MKNLKQAINLLSAVVSTMDTIQITGIDNQDKFVGCASAIRSASKKIADYIASAESDAEKKEDVANG